MDATAGDPGNQSLDIVRMLRQHMAKEAERLAAKTDPKLLFLRWLYEHDSSDRDAVEPIDTRTHDWLYDALAALDD